MLWQGVYTKLNYETSDNYRRYKIVTFNIKFPVILKILR